jgi:hypothetical protein
MLTWAIAWMYSKTGYWVGEDAFAVAMFFDVLIVLGIVSAIAIRK